MNYKNIHKKIFIAGTVVAFVAGLFGSAALAQTAGSPFGKVTSPSAHISDPSGMLSNPANPSGLYQGQFPSQDPNTGIYTSPNATFLVTGSKSVSCSTTIKKFGDIFILGACVMNRFLLSIAISFAMIYFIWGVVQYVLSPGSVEERKKSKQVMLWGVLSMFVIVSVWGIVAALRSLLGI